MKVTAIMEKAKDGYYSCYVEEDLPGFGLSGFGETAEAAKEDMMKAYQEIKEMQQEEGKEVPELDIRKEKFEQLETPMAVLEKI